MRDIVYTRNRDNKYTETCHISVAGGLFVLRMSASLLFFFFFFLNDPPPPEISPLPLHAALPISRGASSSGTYTGPGTRDCPSRSRPSRESVGKTIEIPESRTAVLSGPSRSPVQRSRAGLRGGRNRAVSTESGARAVITIHASCVSSSVK